MNTSKWNYKAGRLLRRMAGSGLAAILVFAFLSTSVSASDSTTLKEKIQDKSDKLSFEYEASVQTYYSDIQQEYKQKGYKPATQTVSPISLKPTLDNGQPGVMVEGKYGNKNPVFAWENSEESATWQFEVPESALYEIYVEYHLNDKGDDAIRSLLIDGEEAFSEMSKIVFQGAWKNAAEEKKYDVLGDQIRPEQISIDRWQQCRIEDGAGFYSLPLQFYLTKGSHKIELTYTSMNLYVSDIKLVPPQIVASYAEVSKDYQKAGFHNVSTEASVQWQAEEQIAEKSQPNIRVETNASSTCQPRSLKFVKFNVFGAWTWRSGNQSVTWSFTVEESGLYQIGLRNLQEWNEGIPSYRQIKIDGEVPFSEMLAYPIDFTRKWTTKTISAENGEPYLFYLKKGEHTLTMSVKLGNIAKILHTLYTDSLRLSELNNEITMLTGSQPDMNYDYELDERITNLIPRLESLVSSMESMVADVRALSNKGTSFEYSVKANISSLKKMIKNTDIIPKNLSDLENIQTSLSDWYLNLQNQPLSLDYIAVASPNQTLRNEKSKITDTISGFFQNLYYSFIRNYDSISTTGAADATTVIDVWVGLSKEWAESLQRLIDDDFTPKSGISVKLNLLPSSQLSTGAINALMLSIVSDTAPDAVLASGNSSPVEFAIRNAVVDLSKMNGFEEFSKSFIPGIWESLRYNGGIYGIPETMNYKVMVYRADILSEMGLALPNTWQDVFAHTLPVLAQNKMEFYIPTDFSMFLYQFGGDYYRNGGQYTGLDSPEAFAAFKYYCDVYTNYDIPIVANFYNRMRSGTMPIGIADFGFCLQLEIAAPELTGKWGIAPIPGILQQDKTIDRSYAGLAGAADIILSSSDKQTECWEFIKWWMSAETQVSYARDLEVMIGPSARLNTANIDAYERLGWDRTDMEIIRKMWSWGRDVPNVLGGYFTSRHLSNAWNRTVLSGMSARDSLEMAVEDISKELFKKQREYNKTFV